MAKTILSNNQIKIIDVISQNDEICRIFYLTGGTALAEYYLDHRLSEDLDFFSEKEFDIQAISVFFAKNKKVIGIKKVDIQQSFNRNLIFLYLKNEVVKTEFTYFPFPRIEKKIKRNKLFVDSLEDIAVNKLFTLYQKPRSRDFIDLYLIIKKTDWKMADLIKKAKIKFDWHIDYLQLGSQFMLAEKVKDYPHMILKLKNEEWQKFFISQAKSFSGKIID
ncbi:nucleotidyl transferase AbiEii/AbiGii toxin family protein [Patescibacteria group bacterium]|nr:nucleotidyl transferase AbiEii/AbiGii toxin family protein [Patescibacteria group bacterium]MBU1563823.1 nucleotidyl transferase AbiEii/AbiGii toxin family protein [Patescibacteria group bacterium]MBU2068233.1 nucleotidyl transferase AbiEii/AbiGii toxin family protein [Patescibacteria group bacterium]